MRGPSRSRCRAGVHRHRRSHRHARSGLVPARDAQGLAIDLENLIGVHARDVHERPGVIDFDAMRHVAGAQVGERRHRRGLNDRDEVDARMIAVKIGIRDERERPVRRHGDRGRKHLDLRAAQQRIGARAHLPQRSIRRAVCDRDVPGGAVGRDRDIVRPVDVRGHDADRDALGNGQRRAVPHELRDDVARLARHQNAIARRGRRCGDESSQQQR